MLQITHSRKSPMNGSVKCRVTLSIGFRRDRILICYSSKRTMIVVIFTDQERKRSKLTKRTACQSSLSQSWQRQSIEGLHSSHCHERGCLLYHSEAVHSNCTLRTVGYPFDPGSISLLPGKFTGTFYQGTMNDVDNLVDRGRNTGYDQPAWYEL